MVEIQDTGCGVDEETQRHTLKKFYQGDLSRVRRGNGLDLALVKRVMDITGGTITVESSPGGGSLFTVCLPTRIVRS